MINGQWIGTSTGETCGRVIADIDFVKGRYEGVLYLILEDVHVPSVVAYFFLPESVQSYETSLQLLPLDRRSGRVVLPEKFAEQFPETVFPKSADTNWICTEQKIEVVWKTSLNSEGKIELFRNHGGDASVLEPLPVKNWQSFKEHVSRLELGEFIYRGHENSSWRLRTHFHRTERADLLRYLAQDVPKLQRNLASFFPNAVDLDNPMIFAAFMSLVQHHGFPTPLLDWTYSPYVAAYFAFNDLEENKVDEGQKVRIFIFDKTEWLKDYNQVLNIATAEPHISILEPAAINNPRLIAQQALATISNIADIESYILLRESQNGKKYLQAIDLDVCDKTAILKELRQMGISPGSLFPGLDGVCRQLKEELFK